MGSDPLDGRLDFDWFLGLTVQAMLEIESLSCCASKID